MESKVSMLGVDPDISTEDNWRPDVNVMEGLQASFDLGSSVTRDAYDYFKAEKAATGRMVPVEEQEAAFPFIEKPFKEPVAEGKLKYLNEIAERRYHLNKMKESGLGTGVGAFAADFAVGVGYSMTDPVEMGIGFGAGFAARKLGTALLKAGSVSIAERTAARTLMQKTAEKIGKTGAMQKLGKSKYGMEIVENVAGSALTEPANYQLQQELRRDYGAADSALNIVVGGTAFTGIKFGAKQVARLGKGTYARLNSALKGAEVENNLKAHQNNVPMNDTPTRQASEEIHQRPKENVEFDEDSKNSEFSVWDETSNQRPVWAAYENNQETSIAFGHYFGDDMIYATSSPNVANTLTSPKYSDGVPTVHKLDISKMNILDADTPIIFEDSGAINTISIFDTLDSKFADDIDESATIGDLLQKVREGIDAGKYSDDDMVDIINKVKENGYDGLKLSFLDTPEQHHGVYIFPDSYKSKATTTAEYKGNSKLYPDLSEKYKNKVEEDLDADKYADENILTDEEGFVAKLEDERLPTEQEVIMATEDRLTKRIEFLTRLDNDGVLAPEQKQALETLKKMEEETRALSEEGLNMIECFGVAN